MTTHYTVYLERMQRF